MNYITDVDVGASAEDMLEGSIDGRLAWVRRSQEAAFTCTDADV